MSSENVGRDEEGWGGIKTIIWPLRQNHVHMISHLHFHVWFIWFGRACRQKLTMFGEAFKAVIGAWTTGQTDRTWMVTSWWQGKYLLPCADVLMCFFFFCEDTCDLGQTCDETRLVEPISGCPFDLSHDPEVELENVGRHSRIRWSDMISECWWPSQRGTTESTDVWGNGNIDLSVSCHGAKNQW